ncbi:transcriptional regulator [Rothia kristinae]|uniref:Transcriptional regulator n=1 Tax=Rothia kristinae TaxID=37923 RepID=A0A1S2N009_9MICC|nr:transcriptional regulator [Rothia kristinae]
MSSPIQIPAVASDLSAKERAAYLAPTLSALADENRLTIVLCLADGAKTNKQLQEATGLSQALVSHHVSALLKAELIEVAPQGRSNLISICCEQLAAPVQRLAHLATLTPAGQRACCTEAEIPARSVVTDAD